MSFQLDLEDPRLRVRMSFPKKDTVRLVFEYPRLPDCRDMVTAAFAELLRPRVSVGEPEVQGQNQEVVDNDAC